MKVVTDLHHIRKHILKTLSLSKWVRFRDMRPPNTDSNLYSYHLKALIKDGYIEHSKQKGYRLSPMGLRFVDHISMETFEPRWQPKILTMIVSINNQDKILLWKKYKQPFIDTWTLPNGKMHYDDVSVESAAVRELSYLSEQPPQNLRHVGVVEYRAFIEQNLTSHVIAHIFTADIADDTLKTRRTERFHMDSIHSFNLAPGTREIIERVRQNGSFFYESFDVDW